MLRAKLKRPLFELNSRGKLLKLDSPLLVGILNTSPESFSEVSSFFEKEKSVLKAQKMIADGADWLDIGGESSSPNSTEISLDDELDRVIPIIEKIREVSEIWISVDTWKAEVARQSLEAGADVINDITALRGDAEMHKVIEEYKVPVIMMFSKDNSARTTKNDTDYLDVMDTLKSFFHERLQFADSKGINKSKIIIDPGMGFFVSGKAKYSFEILSKLSELNELGYPILIGPSRKSFLAGVSQGSSLSFSERDIPCISVSSIALWQGVSFIRFHEVKQGRLLIDTFKYLMKGANN